MNLKDFVDTPLASRAFFLRGMDRYVFFFWGGGSATFLKLAKFIGYLMFLLILLVARWTLWKIESIDALLSPLVRCSCAQLKVDSRR